jgi:dTDP-glucose 4,6-dehydratase
MATIPSLNASDFGPVLGSVLPDLAGKRIFLTGGTGFVGTWLLEFLRLRSEPPPELFVLSREPKAFLDRNPHLAALPWLTLIAGDTLNLETLPPGIEAVLHGATPASRAMNEAHPLAMAEVIVRGTEQLLRLSAKHGVKRFLFLSSGLAYGAQPRDMERIPENRMGCLDSLDPHAAYGNAKHFAEHLCLQHGRAAGFEACIARLFAFVGPLLPLDAHFAAGNFIRDGLAGIPINVQGDGTPLRTYLHAAELAHWLWVLLLQGKAGEAYNVGSDEVVSIRELAEAVAIQCGVPVHIAGTPPPGHLPTRYVPDIRKAKDLGLSPILNLEESLRLTLAWHRRRMEKEPS